MAKRLFHGRIITAENRRKILNELIEYFINNISKQDEYKGLNNSDLMASARGYAIYEIGREKAHHKAFLKGKPSYRYKGRTLPVIISEIGEVFMSDILKEQQKESNGV